MEKVYPLLTNEIRRGKMKIKSKILSLIALTCMSTGGFAVDVSTQAELEAATGDINLLNDITISGAYAPPVLTGAVAGNGYTITFDATVDMSTDGSTGGQSDATDGYFGVFSVAGTGASVDNLNIIYAENFSDTAAKAFGGVIGTNTATVTVSNTNVTINGSIGANTETDFGTGGLVGYPDESLTLNNCSVVVGSTGAISGKGHIGGLTGRTEDSSSFTLTAMGCNVDVQGTIASTATTTANSRIGGLVSFAMMPCTFTNCHVKVSDTMTTPNAANPEVGGLIARSKSSRANATNCTVTYTESVTITNAADTAASGLCGINNTGNDIENVTNCYYFYDGGNSTLPTRADIAAKTASDSYVINFQDLTGAVATVDTYSALVKDWTGSTAATIPAGLTVTKTAGDSNITYASNEFSASGAASGAVTLEFAYTGMTTQSATYGNVEFTSASTPVANDDTAEVFATQSVNIDVLANDTNTTEAPVVTSAPSDGSTQVETDNTITYTAGTTTGDITFDYTVNGVTATVTVTVNPLPVTSDDAVTVLKNDAGVAVDVLANDTATTTIVSVTQGDNGGSVSNNSTDVTYVPATDYVGTETFTYELEGGSTGTVTVTIADFDPTVTSFRGTGTINTASNWNNDLPGVSQTTGAIFIDGTIASFDPASDSDVVINQTAGDIGWDSGYTSPTIKNSGAGSLTWNMTGGAITNVQVLSFDGDTIVNVDGGTFNFYDVGGARFDLDLGSTLNFNSGTTNGGSASGFQHRVTGGSVINYNGGEANYSDWLWAKDATSEINFAGNFKINSWQSAMDTGRAIFGTNDGGQGIVIFKTTWSGSIASPSTTTPWTSTEWGVAMEADEVYFDDGSTQTKITTTNFSTYFVVAAATRSGAEGSLSLNPNVLTPALGLEFVQEGTNVSWTVTDEIGVKEYHVVDALTGEILDVVTAGEGEYSVQVAEGVQVKLVVVDNSGFKQSFYPENGNVVNVSYELSEGWNLIAMPGANADLSSLTGVIAGDLWGWNGTSYELVTVPTVGNAIWVYAPEAVQTTIKAEKVDFTLTLETGWNMVGPTENIVVPNKAYTIYSWNDIYQQISVEDGVLLQGVGYWIFSL